MTAQLLGPLKDATLEVSVAWGADLTDSDGSGWTWTDITADVRQTAGLQASLGRGDEASRSQPAQLTLTLDNSEASYSFGGISPNYPFVRQGTPVRVRVDPDDGGGLRVLFVGFAASWTPSWEAMGRVATVVLIAGGTLRRLERNSPPVVSPYRRAMTELASVKAYWPFEENRGATYATAVRGGSNLIATPAALPDWGASSDFFASAPLPDLGSAELNGVVFPYADTGENEIRCLLRIPAGTPDGTVLAHFSSTGTIGRWDLTYEVVATVPCLGIFVYNRDDTLNSSQIVGFSRLVDRNVRFSLQMRQDGADIKWLFGIIGDDGSGSVSTVYTVASRTTGIISAVKIATGGNADGIIMGHLTIEDEEQASFFDSFDEFSGYDGEYASTSSGGRVERLTAEAGIALTRYTSSGTLTDIDRMGPQPQGSLVGLIAEAETVDQGQLWDGRTIGLAYTTRRYREAGTVALTVRAAALELAPPFEPTDDDQRTRNRAEVALSRGASGSYEDVSGPLGTATIGTYAESVQINGYADQAAAQFAGWLVGLGTVAGYRYPVLTIDLYTAPDLVADALDLIPGDRVQITDPDDVLVGFGTSTVDLIVEGISHSIGPARWRVTLSCSPFSPWGAGASAATTGDLSEFAMRLSEDTVTLAAAAARTATTLSVTVTGTLWSTTADDYPMELSVGGVRAVATACSGASSPQTFTIQPLETARPAGVPVTLHDPPALGL